MALLSLSNCGVVGGLRGVELSFVLVENGGGNRFLFEQFRISIEVSLSEFEFSKRRGNLRVGTVGLFDNIFRVERHQNFASTNNRANLHVARNYFAANLER